MITVESFGPMLYPRYPHSPNGVRFRYNETTRSPFVLFTSLIVVSLPLTMAPNGALQGSPLDVCVGTEFTVGNEASMVGNGMGVSVGNGVGLSVSVGGRGVFVGIAACVSATMVNAADTAVDWISSALIAGSAGCPLQALISAMTTAVIVMIEKCFMPMYVSKYSLAIRITPT